MKKYIQFGFFNKKLLLPFGVAFIQILINIMNIILQEKLKNTLLEMIDVAFSEIIIIFIPLLNISALKTNMNNAKYYGRKKTILHYFILFLIFSIYVILNMFVAIQSNIYMDNHKSFSSPHNSGLSSFESLEMIFICLVSIILLKYKYYIHHIIAIISFILICFFIDLILNNFSYLYDRGALFIIFNIIIVLLDAIDYGYQKYMMDVLFHSFFGITFTIGIVNLIIFGIIIIICLITGKEESVKEEKFMFISFYQYFEDVNIGIIITKHILYFILTFFLNFLRGLTILHLNPDYILISFSISRIINIVIETKQYECLALFPLQFISLMFYLEIFELNFCGLNKNTRRNIEERQIEETLKISKISIINLNEDRKSFASDYSSDVEIDKNYIISCDNNNEQKNEDDSNLD